MKFRGVNINMSPVCTDAGYSSDVRIRLKPYAGVLAWQLSLACAAQKFELPNTSGILFVAVSEKIGNKLYWEGHTLMVCFAMKNTERLKDSRSKEDIFSLIADTILSGIELVDQNASIDLAILSDALEAFKANDCEVEAVVVERRPRGTGLLMIVDAKMTHRGLAVYFVVFRNSSEIFRELIQLTQPDHFFYLRGYFPRIDLDGDQVSLPKKLWKPNPARHEAVMQGHFDRASWGANELYKWSKSLKEILE